MPLLVPLLIVHHLAVECVAWQVNGVHPTAQLLLREPDAFEELFCAIYLYGDQRWCILHYYYIAAHCTAVLLLILMDSAG